MILTLYLLPLVSFNMSQPSSPNTSKNVPGTSATLVLVPFVNLGDLVVERQCFRSMHAPCIPLPKKNSHLGPTPAPAAQSWFHVAANPEASGFLAWPGRRTRPTAFGAGWGRHIQGWSGLSLWYSSILNHFTMGGKEMHCLACTWGVAQKCVMTK